MITILLEKIKNLLSELKTNIEHVGGGANYSTNEVVCGKYVDGTTDVYKRSYVLQSDLYLPAGNTNFTIPEIDNASEIYQILDCTFSRFNSGVIRIYCGRSGNSFVFKTTDGQITALAGSIVTLIYLKNQEE